MTYPDQSRRIKLLQDLSNCLEDQEFAKFCGLKASNYSNIRNGRRLNLESLMLICGRTGADPWWVWTGEGNKYRTEGKKISLAQMKGEALTLSDIELADLISSLSTEMSARVERAS